MKKVLLCAVLIVMGLGLSACERNDYQHPAHRSN
jgi:predicted small secreted protein